ncbi:MAG: hypothetical protein AAF433_13770 [Bacteroidota bacterium]
MLNETVSLRLMDELEEKEELLHGLFSTAADTSSKEVFSAIAQLQLQRLTGGGLRILGEYIQDLRPDGCQQLLLNRVKNSFIAYEQEMLIQSILSYDDDVLNQKLLQVLRENESWDRGAWSYTIRSALAEQDLYL